MKDKTHMIFLADAKKEFGKIQHSFMILKKKNNSEQITYRRNIPQRNRGHS